MPTREEMQSLAQEIVRSYEDRTAGIAQLKQAEAERQRTEAQEIAQRKSDVSTMLKEFDEGHAAMSRELKADLAEVAPALRQAEAERQRTEAREIAQRKSDMSAMLKGFDRDHAAMSKELKADLAKVAPALQKAEAEREQMESQRIAQRKSDVSAMLMGFHEEQAAVRDEWHKLNATMHARRAGKAPKGAPPPPAEEMGEE